MAFVLPRATPFPSSISYGPTQVHKVDIFLLSHVWQAKALQPIMSHAYPSVFF